MLVYFIALILGNTTYGLGAESIKIQTTDGETMSLLEDYEKFVNKYGLVDQKPGSESHNSLTEHALFLIAAKRAGQLTQKVIADTKAKVYKYQIEKGLYARWPGDRTNINSTDDYQALAIISYLCDPQIAKDILSYARSHFYYVNNTKEFDHRGFFMIYQHQVVVMLKIAAGQKPSWFDKEWVYWVVRVTDMQQDSVKLTSFLRFLTDGTSKKVSLAFMEWEQDFWNEYRHGLGESLTAYYNKSQAEIPHPNGKWLENYFGTRME